MATPMMNEAMLVENLAAKQAAISSFEEKKREEQTKACARRFAELVTRVLQAIHIDRDGYGPLSVYEPEDQQAFKKEIQEVCKRYL